MRLWHPKLAIKKRRIPLSNSLELTAQISVIAFVVLSMLSAGLTLSIHDVRLQFNSTRFVISALTSNFVLVPLSAYLITRVVPLERSLAVALLLLGTASGAPILPKLVEFARSNLTLGVALMALLMAGTIVTMPFVLPMILPGAHTNHWSIAKPLLLIVLPSLSVGMSIRAHRGTLAARLQPIFRLASNVALVSVILVTVETDFSNMSQSGGLSTIVVGTAFIFISFGIGFALGGPDADSRIVLALGTTERGSSIAFLVALENFPGSHVVNVLAILVPLARLIQVPGALALGTHIRRGAKSVQQIR
jgi:predicted Na+-dependent transporter